VLFFFADAINVCPMAKSLSDVPIVIAHAREDFFTQ